MTRLCGVLIAIAILVLVVVLPVSAAYYTVAKDLTTNGATVFIGEQGLNVTQALINADTGSVGISNTTIGWWASAADKDTTPPSKTIDLGVGQRYLSMSIAPSDFVGYTGPWYVISSADGKPKGSIFSVADPQLDISVYDFGQAIVVSGKSVPQGAKLGFSVSTNMYQALGAARGPVWNDTRDGYIDIVVKTESGATLISLLNGTAPRVPKPLKQLNVTTLPYYWGDGTTNYWATDALDINGQPAYPTGTYTVSAASRLNNMKDNYQSGGADYTGKTVSQAYTVTLVSDTVKITANKDSVVRSKPFAVTVTGRPGVYYYLWVKGVGTMTGGYDDQPPLITPAQDLVDVGHADAATHVIQDSGGNNVSQDAAYMGPPAAPDNGRRYARIKTSSTGTRVVQFDTTNWTKAQKYTIKVEQNFSVSGTYKSDEVDVKVEKGAVSLVAAGNQKYDIGEEIQFSGTNTINAITYLFISGPGLPPEGAQLQSANPKSNPVVNGVPSSFVQQPVNADNTWGWNWHTEGILIDPGFYTIIATSDPVDALHLANASSYASILIVVKNPSIENFIPLYLGWNFVSTPKKLQNGNDTANIFSTVDTAGHSIFFYNASEQRWHNMTVGEKVRPLDGIWIYSNNPTIVNIIFDTNPMQTPPSKSLAAGWNAIGFSDTSPTLARNALISVQNKWAILIGYNPLQQKYETSIIKGATDSSHGDQLNMYPNKGYWVYMTEAGEIAAISP